MQERRTWPEKIGIYLLHCGAATIGVFVAALLLDLVLGRIFSSRLADQLFTAPVYVLQISVGLICGFLVNRGFHSRSAILAWLPAALWLLWDVDAYMQIGGMSYVRGHLFGTDCGECIEPFFVVSPFYASLAYSAGAWISLIFSRGPFLPMTKHGRDKTRNGIVEPGR